MANFTLSETKMKKLSKAVEEFKAERQRKKQEGLNAWQKKKADKATAKKSENVGLFNVKKYDCWMFPAIDLEMIK